MAFVIFTKNFFSDLGCLGYSSLLIYLSLFYNRDIGVLVGMKYDSTCIKHGRDIS